MPTIDEFKREIRWLGRPLVCFIIFAVLLCVGMVGMTIREMCLRADSITPLYSICKWTLAIGCIIALAWWLAGILKYHAEEE